MSSLGIKSMGGGADENLIGNIFALDNLVFY